jgi:hypothetical protein
MAEGRKRIWQGLPDVPVNRVATGVPESLCPIAAKPQPNPIGFNSAGGGLSRR